MDPDDPRVLALAAVIDALVSDLPEGYALAYAHARAYAYAHAHALAYAYAHAQALAYAHAHAYAHAYVRNYDYARVPKFTDEQKQRIDEAHTLLFA